MKRKTTTLVAISIAFALTPMLLTGCGDSSSSSSGYVELTQPAPPASDAPPSADAQPISEPAKPPEEQGTVSEALNLEFVLDGSGSMAGSAIQEAKAAIHACVDSLPKDKEINLGLVAFDGNGIRETVELGSADSRDRVKFLEQVDAIQAGGGTPLADAMRVASAAVAKQYKRQCYFGNYRMIIVTDGAPDFGQDLNGACADAVSNHASIYTIGFGIGNDHPLRNWARSYETADSGAALTAKLKEATAEPTLSD